jgi:hypothetical protein
MPQIEIPFTIGQRVRTPGGVEFVVNSVSLDHCGHWRVFNDKGSAFLTYDLTLVKPVLDWKRSSGCWRARRWAAFDNGDLFIDGCFCGNFDDPAPWPRQRRSCGTKRGSMTDDIEIGDIGIGDDTSLAARLVRESVEYIIEEGHSCGCDLVRAIMCRYHQGYYDGVVAGVVAIHDGYDEVFMSRARYAFLSELESTLRRLAARSVPKWEETND